MNRAQRLVRLLEMAGLEGICLSEVVPEDAYTLRNAVVEAIASGYRIRSERCRKHRHSSTVSRYYKEGGKKLTVVHGEEDLTSKTASQGGAAVAPPLFPEPFARRGNAL